MNEDRSLARVPGALVRPARAAARRLRLNRALASAATAACLALVAVAVVLVLRKTGLVAEPAARVCLEVAGAGVVVTAVLSYLAGLPPRAGSVALDRHYGLADRISSALSFSEFPPAERSPFMELAIEDGVRAAERVDPRRAVPLRRPRDLGAAAGLMAMTLLIGAFEIRRHKSLPAQKTIDAVEVTPDDLDAMRDFLREQASRDQSDELKAATAEFNQLIEDLAQRRLDRTEAFRQMQALEDKLLQGREADRKALEENLERIGTELKKAELTRPAGEALDAHELPKASDEMKKLAEKLRSKSSALDKTALEKAREALKKVSEGEQARQERIAQQREELQKELLREKEAQRRNDGGASEEEQSLLKKKQRELERLQREEEKAQAGARQLDRLDRDLAQAAEDLMKDLGASAKDLDQGAEDINRMARDEMTQEEKQQLKEKLDELREMLRQQGQGGSQQMARLRRFQARAHGRSGGGQGQKGQGAEGRQGQGQPGQEHGEGEGEGAEAQGSQGEHGGSESGEAQGQSGQGGQGQSGRSQGSGGDVWVMGPNGEKLLMLSQSRGAGSGGGESGNGGGGTGTPQRNSWGTGHDGNVQAGATHGMGSTEDTQVAGQDTGQGGSRSEVIEGAAERGFASRRYTKVYREYHAVAEEALGKDDIPGGYRFYVRRYFQLIRPRD